MSEFPKEFIANYLDAGTLPAMSDRHYFQQQIYWTQIYRARHICYHENLGDCPSLEDVRACIGKKRKKQLLILFGTKPSHSVRNL